DVAAVAEVGRRGLRIDGDANRLRPIAGADAGRHAEPWRGVDAHRVRRPIFVRVRLGHRGEVELLDALAGEGEADHTAGVLDHEVDHLGRDQLRRADQVALVLTIFVVGDDDQFAGSDIVDGLVYGS